MVIKWAGQRDGGNAKRNCVDYSIIVPTRNMAIL